MTQVNRTNANNDFGYYVQMKAGDVFFTYQHLASIESWVKVGTKIDVGQTFAVSGNTGIGTGYHLHVTVATVAALCPKITTASDVERDNYMDPRIYID